MQTTLSNTSNANPFPPTQLSSREIEVLRLIVEGNTNTEIASTLFVSPNTVKTHVRNILNKLGVSDRVQAAVFALRHNLL